ncbi:hypothetical protein DCAR_0521949 [Daucus carota subsp. sativus]|uniref:DC1 domain-containing protein n=1 Tax=Daucus carota subsp. sativus TaxID=79200 RepID=A0AAF0X7F0_DAUCS|nr:hypothetical protein DCAR_0521949 [Daucus carota subsp. sativus]
MEDIKAYHSSHLNHPLVLRNFNKPFHCDGCKEQGFGTRYRCESSDCHPLPPLPSVPGCMFNSRTATHEFYPGCDLKFSDEPRKRGTWCNACGNEINGFVYYCKDKDLDLHPCCLELKGKMVTDGATFRLHDKVKSKCIWCKSKSLKGKSEGGWSYKSECNKYHVHVCYRNDSSELENRGI